MASPQIKNGYTPIANEVVEALAKAQLSGREFRVLMVVFRKTWGWQKVSDRISGGQVALATGIDRRHVASLIKNLERRSFLVRSETGAGQQSATCRFNKNYEEWDGGIHSVTHNLFPSTKKGARSSTENGTKLAPKTVLEVAPFSVHTKERRKKKVLRKGKKTFFNKTSARIRQSSGLRSIGEVIQKRA